MNGALCALAVTVGACGSAGIPAGDDPGTGSSTLEIDAEVEVTNVVPNARDAADFVTAFEVEVRRNGAIVSDAVVVIETTDGAVELVFQSSQDDGRYRGTLAGYGGRFVLDVDAGDDYVHGVRVQGPDAHWFESPTMGASVPGTEPLVVAWSRDGAADAARIETKELDDLAIEDTGDYTLPVGTLDHDDGEVRDDRVRVWRQNRVVPDGAAGSSRFTVEVRNEVEFLVMP